MDMKQKIVTLMGAALGCLILVVLSGAVYGAYLALRAFGWIA